jgi:hypothetical protein
MKNYTGFYVKNGPMSDPAMVPMGPTGSGSPMLTITADLNLNLFTYDHIGKKLSHCLKSYVNG